MESDIGRVESTAGMYIHLQYSLKIPYIGINSRMYFF